VDTLTRKSNNLVSTSVIASDANRTRNGDDRNIDEGVINPAPWDRRNGDDRNIDEGVINPAPWDRRNGALSSSRSSL
jgi:hypothetical protein